jgi:hypothetical protein
MRRSLVVLALAMAGVLLLDAPAWAPRLYGMRLDTDGRGNPPIIVWSAALNASAADPTERQEQYEQVPAGTTVSATGSYEFDDTPIEGPQNPTRNGVEERCTPGKFVVLTSERVQVPAPEGVPLDALAEPAVGRIEAGNPPTFKLELRIVEEAWGEYYLRVRCVARQDLAREGVQGAPDEEELEQLGEFLDSSEGEQERPFKPFRNFGTNLYVEPKEG